MSLSFNPIEPWYLVAAVAVAVTVLTLWAYLPRLRDTSGLGKWMVLGLRMLALALCVLAALRPSVIYQEKKTQPAAITVLLDESTSMQITDEVRNQSRWDVARQALRQVREATKDLGSNVEVAFYRFASDLRDDVPDDDAPPEGASTALGTAMLEAVKRQAGTQVVRMVVLSDGGSNDGHPPLDAAERLKAMNVPVDTVAFGEETAGAGSRDIAVREVVAGPTVFVKNQLQVRGSLQVRGFAGRTLDVEMLAEDQVVDTKQVTVPDGAEVVPVSGLTYIPETPGETKITLRVEPQEGELVKTNNEMSTFVTVLKGGLSVLYIQGRNHSWEPRFLVPALDASPDIQTELIVLRQPVQGGRGELSDEELAPGKHDVFILGDLPANHLTRPQQEALAVAVERGGAGLMMLGGRDSFGAGGWANTAMARVLPVAIDPSDGELEPEEGLKIRPAASLDSYILRIGASAAESEHLWEALPPIPSPINRLGSPKPAAQLLAEGPNREPVMIAQDAGAGRSLAFASETWPWARKSEETRQAHRKFWRQVILWLARKEDQGETQIKLALDRRRLAVGQKLDLTVTARDENNQPLPGVQYETTVTRTELGAPSEPVELFQQDEVARGSYFATGEPGEYRVTVRGLHHGQDLGQDSARFLVYQDDRELENPAADRALLRQIAQITGGEAVPPEQLYRRLNAIDEDAFTEYVTATERRLWDNWPFFLAFTAILTLEWWLRKRKGLV